MKKKKTHLLHTPVPDSHAVLVIVLVVSFIVILLLLWLGSAASLPNEHVRVNGDSVAIAERARETIQLAKLRELNPWTESMDKTETSGEFGLYCGGELAEENAETYRAVGQNRTVYSFVNEPGLTNAKVTKDNLDAFILSGGWWLCRQATTDGMEIEVYTDSNRDLMYIQNDQTYVTVRVVFGG